MGKGDIKSRKGKIANGSYGTRRKKHSSASAAPVAKPEAAVKAAKPAAAKAEAKAPAAKKPAAKNKPAAK